MIKKLRLKHIRINGQTWSVNEFITFIHHQLNDPEIPDFLRELYLFYKKWFDNNDNIDVKTSGSTGQPKTIRFKKWQLVRSAQQTGDYFQLAGMDNCLLCLPVQFIAGKLMVVRAMVYDLDLLVVEPSLKPLQGLGKTVDFAAMTPQQVLVSINGKEDFSGVQSLIIGGGEVSRELVSKFQTISTSCYATYGMTETLTHIAVKQLNGTKAQDCFTCLPGISINTDSRSCLVINADYLDNEIHTNDVVELLEENKFRWKGRIDNVINSGGIKIFPEQIEQELAPLIPAKYFIASMPDSFLGEKVILVIEGNELSGIDENFLLKLKELLPRHHSPKEIFYLKQFTYTISGKINRRECLDRLF